MITAMKKNNLLIVLFIIISTPKTFLPMDPTNIAVQLWNTTPESLDDALEQIHATKAALVQQAVKKLCFVNTKNGSVNASDIKTKPEWLRLLFARTYYRIYGRNIGQHVNVSDIGSFSISELLEGQEVPVTTVKQTCGLPLFISGMQRRIPRAVPQNGLLDLAGRKIGDLEGLYLIEGVPDRLFSLDLADNKLEIMPGELESLTELRWLNLSGNPLHKKREGSLYDSDDLAVLRTRIRSGDFSVQHDRPRGCFQLSVEEPLDIPDSNNFDLDFKRYLPEE